MVELYDIDAAVILLYPPEVIEAKVHEMKEYGPVHPAVAHDAECPPFVL